MGQGAFEAATAARRSRAPTSGSALSATASTTLAGVGGVDAGVVCLIVAAAVRAGRRVSAEGCSSARLICVSAFAPLGTELASAESAAVLMTCSIVVVPPSIVVVMPISGSGSRRGEVRKSATASATGLLVSRSSWRITSSGALRAASEPRHCGLPRRSLLSNTLIGTGSPSRRLVAITR